MQNNCHGAFFFDNPFVNFLGTICRETPLALAKGVPFPPISQALRASSAAIRGLKSLMGIDGDHSGIGVKPQVRIFELRYQVIVGKLRFDDK